MNSRRGEIKIKLGDQEYTAVPSHKALAWIESELGKIIPVASDFHEGQIGLKNVAVILHSCIRAACDNPKDAPTYDELAELIVYEGLGANCRPVKSAITLLASFLSPKGEDEGKPAGSPGAP